MTREDIECIIKWFSHIEQLATDGKTANGFQMSTDKILATIKVVAKDSREYVEKFCNDSVPNDLEEAAVSFSQKSSDGHNYRDLRVGFIAGAKWQADNAPLPEDTIIWNDGFKTGREAGARDMKEQMMKEAVKWLKETGVNNLYISMFQRDMEGKK